MSDKPTPWRYSEAKKLLRNDIIEGRVCRDDMTDEQIYLSRPNYAVYNFENFKTNVKNLVDAIIRDQTRANRDNDAAKHDLKILTVDAATVAASTGKVRWPGSAAARLLKLDIDANKHLELKPKPLHASRVEYQHFSLEEFRKHIYQETSSRLQKSYWLAHKAEKEKEKEKARNNTDF